MREVDPGEALSYMEEWGGDIEFSHLKSVVARRKLSASHQQILNSVKDLGESLETSTHISEGRVQVKGRVSQEQRAVIRGAAKKLKNWKKGPFDILGVFIESEWRSDWKWDRFKQVLGSLQGQRVLDIGCNNGYFMYRMEQAGAFSVLGIDPVSLFRAQFQLIQCFSKSPRLFLEPFGVQNLFAFRSVFDTVFSMGILYHHPDPLRQLKDIYSSLKPGGVLILETIGVEGKDHVALYPQGSYALMKNVFSIPTLPTLVHWLERCRFHSIEVISTQWEQEREQRSTPWSASVSYRDFLNPDNPKQTQEGYPAPKRFTVRGTKGQSC